MSVHSESAKGICECLLRRSGEALMNGDFEPFLECFALPQEVQTFDGVRTVSGREDLQSLFDGMCAYFGQIGVTELVRHCVEADFRDEETIVSTHETRLLGKTELLSRPYPVLSIIKRIDEVWKIQHSQYAIVDAPAHSAILLGRSSPSNDDDSQFG